MRKTLFYPLFLLLFFVQDERKEEPVVNPKKTEEKHIESPVRTEDSAILPFEFIKNTVAGIKFGEEVWTNCFAMKVDMERKCWLVPTSLTGDQAGDRCLKIKRTETGFHVSFENINHLWRASDKFDTNKERLIPVKSVSGR